MRSCPYCASEVSTGVYANVVLCDCGCLYRPIRHCANPYCAESFTDTLEIHRQMLASLVSQLPPGPWQSVLEIGAATGLLVGAFAARFGQTAYHAVEPATDMAERLRRLPIRVTAKTFDEAELDEPVDLVLCCNVDYLFGDLNRCMDKIHAALRPDGLLVIHRNVFLEQQAYVGWSKPFSHLSELFTQNPLISSWFMLAQYHEFLGRRFTIERTITESTGVGVSKTYFCRRAERRDPAPLMLRDQALERLGALGYQPHAAAS